MIHTIVLRGCGHYEEGTADGAVTPGMAVTLDADGMYTQVAATQANALKGGLILALEDALQGRTTRDAYAQGERLFLYIPQEGDIVNVLVKSGANIAVGDKLVEEAAGSGLFVEAAGTEVKFRLEALESSGGALAANTHMKCRVL